MYSDKKITTKISAAILAICMAMPNTVSVYAKEMVSMKSDIQDNMAVISKSMQPVLERAYDRAKLKIRKEIAEKGYDYSLTMESFDDQGNPFTGYDYTHFICLYAAIKKTKEKTGQGMGDGIDGLDFIKVETKEETGKEVVPERIDIYEEAEGGYIRTGRDYICEEVTIDEYEDPDGDGIYEKNGSKTIEPLMRDIKYASVSLSLMDDEEICTALGVEPDKVMELAEHMEDKATSQAKAEVFAQLVFNRNAGEQSPEDKERIERALSLTDNPARQAIVITASSLINRVPYLWGGKALNPGYDNTWWTYLSDGKQKGLDCSGFVQWAYMTAGFDRNIYSDMQSTWNILNSNDYEKISSSELKPGDLGLKVPGGGTNHVGIYMGDGLWIHCSSGSDTVVISEYPKFQIFRRVPLLAKYDGTGALSKEELDKFEHSEYLDDMSENGSTENIPDVVPDIDGELNAGTYGNDIYAPDNANSTDNTDITGEIPEITPYYVTESEYSDEDLYWMARIVQAEAGHEGYNGWIAVAEVILNRVVSPKYPDSVYGVVSQSGQFTTFSKARKYNDTDLDVQLVEACRQVLAGRLQVLGNKDVMYFYNPKASSSKYHKGRTPFVEIGNHMFLL